MLEVTLFRHGKTFGNTLGRYIGCRTDEHLIDQEAAYLKSLQMPQPDRIYTSPMYRCIESAQALFGDRETVVVEDLKEIDFGLFENRNYKELAAVPEYQAWIDSSGTLDFPGGEPTEVFRKRCRNAFSGIIKEAVRDGLHSIALVVHGGTVMSVLSAFASPAGDYFQYQLRNGESYHGIVKEEEGSFCLIDLKKRER